MSAVGVRELKEHTSRIVRRVREEGETIEVTRRGEVVDLLTPVRRRVADGQQGDTPWSDLDSLVADISAHWPATVSTAEAVDEGRREL